MRAACASLTVIVFGLASCGVRDQREPEEPEDAPSVFASAFHESNCSPWALPSTPVGTTIDARIFQPDGTRDRLSSVVEGLVGGGVTIRNGRYPPGISEPMMDPVTTTSLATILPLRQESTYSGSDYGRIFEYASNPNAFLSSLTLGEPAQISVSETLTANGQVNSAIHNFEVTLVSCGTLEWAGGNSPVRVYRTVTFNQTGNADGSVENEARRTATLAYVAEDLGLPLRREWESGAYELVDSVKLGGA